MVVTQDYTLPVCQGWGKNDLTIANTISFPSLLLFLEDLQWNASLVSSGSSLNLAFYETKCLTNSYFGHWVSSQKLAQIHQLA